MLRPVPGLEHRERDHQTLSAKPSRNSEQAAVV